MRTNPYSLDLRQRVLKFIESKKETAEIFNLHHNTVSRW